MGMTHETANGRTTRLYRWHVLAPLPGGLIFVALLLFALIVLPPLMHTRSEALRSHLTDDVLALNDALTATENDVQELQAALRGYILTQQPAFLAQYNAAQASLASNLQRVASLAARVDLAMDGQVAALVGIVNRWQQEAGERQIAFVQAGRSESAIQEIASGHSQVLFDTLRQHIQTLHSQAQHARSSLLVEINRWRIAQGLLTSGLAGLGLVAGGFINRRLSAYRYPDARPAGGTRAQRAPVCKRHDRTPTPAGRLRSFAGRDPLRREGIHPASPAESSGGGIARPGTAWHGPAHLPHDLPDLSS